MNKLFDELKLTGKLPSPSGVGMKILRLTQSDDFCTDEIARTIQGDPALTGRVLKLANTARNASAEPVTTVEGALVRLGVRTVRNVALSFSLVSSYRGGACEGFDYGLYWSASLARAVLAQQIATRLKTVNPADAYVCGLLSEIGCLALASVHPATYSDVILLHRGRGSSQLAELERQKFEIDHRDVALALFIDWGLPETYARAASIYELERGVDADDPNIDQLADILRISGVIGEIMARGGQLQPGVMDRLERARERTGLDVGDVWAIADAAVEEWKEWGQVLDIDTTEVEPFERIAAHADADGGEADVPRDAATRVSEMFVRAEPKGHAPDKLTVLAVDDDPLSLKLLSKHLRSDDMDVVEAVNGADALKKALEVNPHVVITDWMMPEIDGIELCRALRRFETGRSMYVIILTGREEEDRIIEAFDAGIDDYVTKPFPPRVLLARVRAGERVVALQAQVTHDKRLMEEQLGELAVLNRRLQQASLTDSLTALPNRRYAMNCLLEEWAKSLSTSRSLSAIMIDIDHFKGVNDTYGHGVGDIVLRDTARVFSEVTRAGETVCRVGGEEFLVICANTDAEGAFACGERIRKAVEANRITAGDFDDSVTVSLGVAEMTEDIASVDDLLRAADIAVYGSKEHGRNRTTRYEGHPTPV